LLDTATGRERATIVSDGGFRFSPDSRLLALERKSTDGDHGSLVEVCNVQTGEKETALHPGRVFGEEGYKFDFSPDGRFLMIQDRPPNRPEADHIRFWSVQTREDVGRIEGKLCTIKTSPDFHRVATFTSHLKVDRVLLWSSPCDGPPRLLHETPVSADSVAISPDLSTFATLNAPQDRPTRAEVAIWDLATGQKRQTFQYDAKGAYRESTHLSFNLDGTVLIAEGDSGDGRFASDPQTEVWDIASAPRQIGSFAGRATLSPNGRWLALSTAKGRLLYRIPTMELHADLSNSEDRAGGPGIPEFSPDSRLIAISCLHRQTGAFPGKPWVPYFLQPYLPDDDGTIARLWDTQTGKELANFPQCRWAHFSPNGTTLVTQGWIRSPKLWSLPLRKPLTQVLARTVIAWVALVVMLHCVRAWVGRKQLAPKTSLDCGPSQAGSYTS
jgi:WD40 repeat protein